MDGGPISGVDLWVIPSYNPDGLARGTRENAQGVDLNRNFPHRWADLDGTYESGSGPASEPETRAVMRFLRDVRPARVLSFHQPLYGVDKDTKTPAYSRRVAGPARAAPQVVHLRWRVPRDDGGLVQQDVRRHRDHRGVRRAPDAPPDAGRAPAPGAVDLGRHAAEPDGRSGAVSGPRRPASRLATNAATAAWWSAVAPVSVIIELSNASDSSKEWPAA